MVSFTKLLRSASLAFAAGVFLLAGTSVSAQTAIQSGTTVKVSGGTTFVNGGELDLSTGATLQNDGTLILKGNLINNNVTDNSLGSGTITMQGTSAQTISGPNVFGTLVINNSAGVSLTGTADNKVNTALTLTSGKLNIGDVNLLLGPTVTSVGGTPTASNMVVAEGTGQLRKEFSGTGSFIFPVGDNTGTAEFSPVTLTFATGTFNPGNWIGINLKNLAYDPVNYTAPYINRYWVVTNNPTVPVSGFTCDATFNYVQADVNGTTTQESEMHCTKVAPDPVVTYDLVNNASNLLTASGLTSFSTFTGVKGAQTTQLYAMLQGPYSAGSMTTNLTTLPLGSRSDDTKFPNQQPYNVAPWNYTGTEQISSIPANTVDWVLVELRQGTAAGTSVSLARRAGFILNNGTITDLDGTSALKFYNVVVDAGNNVYFRIYHRNHMPVMAQGAATYTGGVYGYDFRTGSTQFYPGTGAGCVQLSSSPVIWGMLAGDASNDGSVYLDDRNGYWVPVSGYNTRYLRGDFNLDKNAFLDDINTKWVPNSGLNNPLP